MLWLVYLLCSCLLPPFLLVIFTTVLLASSGRSLGIRKRYIRSLLALFEVSQRCLLSVIRLYYCFSTLALPVGRAWRPWRDRGSSESSPAPPRSSGRRPSTT